MNRYLTANTYSNGAGAGYGGGSYGSGGYGTQLLDEPPPGTINANGTAGDIERLYNSFMPNGIIPGGQDAGVLVNPPVKRGQDADIAKPAPDIVGNKNDKGFGDYLPYILAAGAAGVVIWLIVK